MAQLSSLVSHLLRRTGFGARPDERDTYSRLSYAGAVDSLINFDPAATDIDASAGTPGYIGITTSGGQFLPGTVIRDARQRWLFRMVHSPAPLQEKMALFWHQHFATAYSKISGIVGDTDAARMMAAKPSEDPGGARGQIELFRQQGLGSFRDLLVQVAQDPAMLVWLDGQLNTKTKPQENFGRELMELFTVGVDHYVETDVYAAARVFSGWNLTTLRSGTATAVRAFVFRSGDHDTAAKDFSFPIYPNGSTRIEARSAAAGLQDGFDLINALAIHPETARRLARRLWTWFVSEVDAPPADFVESIASVYLQNDTQMKPVVRAVLFSKYFVDPSRQYQRYSWPVEFVVRALKEVGYVGFSVNDALTPLVNMGQQLFEPPDVNGWELGPGWFSTGGMLARMNFAAALATNQKFALREAARPAKSTPDALVDFVLGTLSAPPATRDEDRATLLEYVQSGGPWTGSDAQLLTKAAGLVHLVVGSGEYQIV